MTTFLVSIHAFASIIGLLIIVLFVSQQPSYYQKILTMTATCSFLGLIGYLFELLANTLGEAMIAVRVGYLGKCYAMVLFLFFIQKYCDMEISKKVTATIVAFNTFILLIVFTSPWHKLYYTSYEFVVENNYKHLVLGKGIVYYIFMLETLIVMFTFIYTACTTMLKRSGKQKSRLVLLCASGIVPAIALILNLLPIMKGVDPTPIGILISTVLAGLNVLKYGLLDTMQLASESVMDASSAGLIVVGTTKKFLFANQNAYKIFPELAKKGIADEFAWDLFEGISSSTINAKRTLERDGSVYELDFSVLNETAIKSETGTGGYMVWVFDKTKDYNYTKELERIRKEAEEANVAKSMFLAKMSHEIRTPMNGIIGFTQLINEQEIDDSTREYLGYIESSSSALLDIINDILDISKIESGKMNIVNVDYSIDEMLRDVSVMIKTQADAKNLYFNTNIKDGLPDTLVGDYTRLREILVNILGNAVKYTYDGGVTFNVDYTMNSDDVLLEMHVIDTGIGIKSEKINSIFDVFEQADNRGNYHVEGTGLGLSIARQLAELMGGSLTVSSEYGNGSDFCVIMPQKISKTKIVAENKELNEVKFYDLKVLLVDDNEINLKVESSILKKLGMNVDIVDSGSKAVANCEMNQYDLILMDHMMPGMDGVETMKRIRQDSKFNSTTPIIVVTANAIVGIRQELENQGFDGYISKPIDKKLLNQELVRILPENKINNVVISDENRQIKKEKSLQEKVQERLDDVLIDVDKALEYCGDIEDYLDILEIVYETAEDKVSSINDFYVSEDWNNYTILVHSLKSSLNNIGASNAGEKARKLEMAGKSDDIQYIKNNHREFVELYKNINDIVRIVLEENRESFIKKIENENNSIVSMDSSKNNEDNQLIKEMLDSINALIDELEVDKAVAIIDNMTDLSMENSSMQLLMNTKNSLEMFNMEQAKEYISQIHI